MSSTCPVLVVVGVSLWVAVRRFFFEDFPLVRRLYPTSSAEQKQNKKTKCQDGTLSEGVVG
jgi:hypothetical protein